MVAPRLIMSFGRAPSYGGCVARLNSLGDCARNSDSPRLASHRQEILPEAANESQQGFSLAKCYIAHDHHPRFSDGL